MILEAHKRSEWVDFPVYLASALWHQHSLQGWFNLRQVKQELRNHLNESLRGAVFVIRFDLDGE